MQNTINLYSNEWFDVEETLKIFIGDRVRVKNLEIIEAVIEELVNSEALVMGLFEKSDNDYKFVLLMKKYLLVCMRSERNSFHVIAVMNEYDIKKKHIKEYIYNKPILNLVPRNKVMVILQTVYEDEKTYFEYPDSMSDEDWEMPQDYFEFMDRNIREYFENSGSEDENSYEIGRSFRKNILDPIRDYTHYEDEAEKVEIISGDSLVYVGKRSTTTGASLNNTTYVFNCVVYDEKIFRPDVRISVETVNFGEDGERKLLNGVIVSVMSEEENTLVEISFSSEFNDSEIPDSGRIYLQYNTVQRRVREKVLSDIERFKIKSKYMYKTFNKFETEGYEENVPYLEEFKDKLQHPKEGEFAPNVFQMEAIEKGIKTKDIQLVLGPPGTGKTTVIVAWIDYYTKIGKRVLVSSQNNKAVDNVLERIAQNKNIGIIRIGNEKMIQDNVKEFMPENQSEKLYLSYKKTFSENQDKYKVDLEKLRCLIELSEVDYRLLEGYKSIADEISYCYKNLNNYLMDLSVLFENINECKKDIEILMDARAKKYIYISETKKKNIFIRFLRIPISLGVKKDISKLNSDIKEQNKKYDYSVEEYNRISFEFQKKLKDEEFIKYKNELVEIKDKIRCNGTLSMEYTLPYDSFNCNFKFENITQCMEDVKNFKNRCLESVENISKLKSAISEWDMALEEKRNEIMTNILIEGADVVGATCIGINSNRKFSEVEFDVSIIDEAGQIQIHNIIVPMTRAKKNLLLGDYLQIPPIVNDEVAKLCKIDGVSMELLKESFFEYLYKNEALPKENKTLLGIQFRMPSEIASIISHKFYEDNYESVASKENMKSICGEIFDRPLVVISTSDGDKEKRCEKPAAGGGYINDYESDLIGNIIFRIITSGALSSSEIGIIAPYSKQVANIRKVLRRKVYSLTDEEIVSMAATLDSYQGQERKLIIYSSTRSDYKKESKQPRIGFMKELRRLNVAFTRCKNQMIVIGDMDFLTTCEYEVLDEKGKKVPNQSEKGYAKFMGYFVSEVKNGKGQFVLSKEILN
ncbi:MULTISPECIES: AAA domain-containing protein [Clostridium]|uniref:AAA domain-containing protein n=1 Tax=Clostridium TaxID=1485 RepID=UPI000824A754|nr:MULTISPECIES: AAA domain-containing protein [Clostridium]PJI06846.1 hypothetical protein CUB90_02720 [Clostridium sp. CT7]